MSSVDGPESHFRPPADDMGEFEVERILDHRRVRRGRGVRDEYLVKWVGYGLFESSWEPVDNLSNAARALADFRRARARESAGGG